MKITVIGMWGGFPKKEGPTAGYLIEEDNEKLLIDCGSGVLVNLQKHIDLNDIHHVILSHYHEDHASDAGSFMYSRLVNTQLKRVNKALTIYGPYEADKQKFFQSVPHTNFKIINEKKTLEIGPFEISFLQTIHSVETYAMAINCKGKKFVYTADTSYTETLIPFIKNADLLLAEASLYDGMDGKAFGHMTGGEAGLLAQKAEVKQLILTHLPHYGNTEELVESAKKQGVKNVKLAHVDMLIKVSQFHNTDLSLRRYTM